MNIAESAQMSWRAIRDHKLRSVLTVLGVVIGVGSVITFVTLGASLQAAIVGDVVMSSPTSTSRSVPHRVVDRVDRAVVAGTRFPSSRNTTSNNYATSKTSWR